MKITIADKFTALVPFIDAILFVSALYFVWRSFYKMRIGKIEK